MKAARAAAGLGAATCFVAAALLILQAGLPERATFTGLEIGGVLTAPELGALAPQFRATMSDSGTLSLAELRGTPVILNFWATWCQPCAIELPHLQRLHERYPSDELRIIAINTGEPIETIAPWAAQLQLSLEIALDPDFQIMTAFAVRGQPQTFVIDRYGVVRDIFFGAVDFDTLNRAVQPLLK